jgi:hypothetical protein
MSNKHGIPRCQVKGRDKSRSRVVSIFEGHCCGLVPRMARASNAIAENVWVANPDGFAYASPHVGSWMRWTSSIGQSCARQAALVSLVQSGLRHSDQRPTSYYRTVGLCDFTESGSYLERFVVMSINSPGTILGNRGSSVQEGRGMGS